MVNEVMKFITDYDPEVGKASTRKRRMLSWQQRIRILLLQDLPPATV